MGYRVCYVLASTDWGSMIVNRMDYNMETKGGVGLIFLEFGTYEETEVAATRQLLNGLRQTRGDGVVVIDGGANVGGIAVPLATHMRGWGEVIAIEPQERVFYALCGNIALNNLFNARASRVALGDAEGIVEFPTLNYQDAADSGGVSLVNKSQFQVGTDPVRIRTIDSFKLPRVDLIKLDIEGYEIKALAGARETLEASKPVIIAEHLFCKADELQAALPQYQWFAAGWNSIFIHKQDPLIDMVQVRIKD